MSIISHYSAGESKVAGPAHEVEGRMKASESERAQTHALIDSGHLIAANTPAHVEHRKARLIAESNGAPTIAPEHRGALARGPVSEAPVEARRAFERQIGGNNIQPCWFMTRGAELRRTVGRIHIRDVRRRLGWATGFLVAPNLLVTNRHVLDSPETAQCSRVEFDYEETFDGDILPSAIFDLCPDRLFVFDPASRGRDYALVAVAPRARGDCPRPDAELAEFGYNTIVRDDGKLLKGEPINIVHHPEGQPRQVSMRENRMTAQDGPALQDMWLHYETDTHQGSSGAPLFNDQWEVVGVHHMGVEKRNEDGQILAIGGSVWTPDMGEGQKWWYANEGLRISRFMRDVEAQLTAHRDPSLPAVAERVVTAEGTALVEAMLESAA